MAWFKTVPFAELQDGRGRRVVVDGLPVALFLVDGQVYATEDTCSHAEASLAEGRLEGKVVVCPRHGARFDITSGRALSLPAITGIATFPTKVEDGYVWVDVE
ncbi:MAG: non-heme iron oxygenase ferredoxin subunit [Limnochordales bacterium]|nr:non-heme iron oxygenase ferredoxin subunit [Limnochordales bacterium]